MKFIYFLLVIVIILSSILSFIYGALDINANLTEFIKHRQRRSLIFQGGGIIKFVIGPILPIDLGDPVPWRTMLCFYNIHGGEYALPTTPVYPWDKWEDTFARSLKKMRTNFDLYGEYREDESRLFVYTAFENYMNSQKIDGRACLLRSICLNAQISQHYGVFSEILNVVLTPGKEKLHTAYREAHAAGKFGSDCLNLYAACPWGSNLLDPYLKEF